MKSQVWSISNQILKNLRDSGEQVMSERILYRLFKSPGREHQQAFIRLFILTVVFPYIWITHRNDPQVLQNLAIAATILFTISLSFFGWIIYKPQTSPARYIISTTIDISALSYGVYLAGEYGSALYPLYLLITFGYGLRFGRYYLAYCAGISIVGFAVVRQLSEYWQDHTILFSGLVLGLIFLPAFAFTLISYLEKAIKEAKIANQAKSQFMANMFHELRTPLNGILGSNELLKVTESEAERKEYTDTIDYSVNTLLSLIDNILDISKIEAGKVDIKKSDFDLHSMLYQTVKMLTHIANSKGLALKLHVNPDVPFALVGDHDHLRQILVNLIGNALKFTEEGYVKVNVSLKECNNKRALIRYEVIDTGPGIKKEDQQLIFERFNQADNSDTRKHSGTGLGTTIAKELIEMLGGYIAVESALGVGSNFWFELPFQLQQSNIEANDDLNKANVILLHDADSRPKELLKYFTLWGVSVYETTSATDVINYANSKYNEGILVHSIVITKSLIEFNPRSVIQKMRGELKRETANIIFISDHIDNNTAQDLLSLGFDHVLPAEVEKSQIYNAIHSSPLFNSEQSNVESIFNHQNKIASHKYNILLAEDNPINQRIISRLLEQAGHTVDIADNGKQALEILRKQDYDLCIFDMQMPEMGGIEAIKIFKESYPGRVMPFIVLSANATTGAMDECESVGVSMYLPKPVRYGTLLSAVESVTSKLIENPDSYVEDIDDEYSLEDDYQILPAIETLNTEKLDFILDQPEEAKIYYDRFLKEMLKTINQLERHRTNNYDEFKRIAHSLKGLSGNLGMEKLFKVTTAIDNLTVTEYEETLGPYYDAILFEINKAIFAFWVFSSEGANKSVAFISKQT